MAINYKSALELVFKNLNNDDGFDERFVKRLNETINRLPEEEKQIIYLRYFEDRTQSEVAGILGKSQVGVSRTEQKTLKKIRNNYQNVA